MKHTRADFITTGWTLIAQLRSAEGDERVALQEKLAQCYWPPVYSYYRSLGTNGLDAADLTQGFFADVVIGRNLFERADSSRGRLRSLLRTAARRYRIDTCRPSSTRTRSIDPEALDREERFLEADAEATPEEQFDRRWATMSLDLALQLCEERLRQQDLKRHWKVFEAYIVQPAVNGNCPPDLGDLAQEHGFASRVHAASAMKVVRKHFRIALREVAAGASTDAADQEAEYSDLVGLLVG